MGTIAKLKDLFWKHDGKPFNVSTTETNRECVRVYCLKVLKDVLEKKT